MFAFTAERCANTGRLMWDFGDGMTSTENAPRHVYNTEGTFSVQLSADCGRAAASVTLRSLTGTWVAEIGLGPVIHVLSITQQPASNGRSALTGQWTVERRDGQPSTVSPITGSVYRRIDTDPGTVDLLQHGDCMRNSSGGEVSSDSRQLTLRNITGSAQCGLAPILIFLRR